MMICKQPGAPVTFEFRGVKKKGFYITTREVKRKGRARELATLVTGDETSLDRHVDVILSGETIYEVSHCKVDTKRKVNPDAMDQYYDLKNRIRDSKASQRSSRLADADLELHNLCEGDSFEVKFKHGWVDATYHGFTASGKVRFRDASRRNSKRPGTIHPKFARVKK